jgi:hypothetical protein
MVESPLFRQIVPPLDVYRGNGFRVTGLSVDATAQELSRHLARTQMVERLNGPPAEGADPPAPRLEDVRAAVERLRDPEARLIHELFWFWPLVEGGGPEDLALASLSEGDRENARQLWLQGAEGGAGCIARHNLAVLAHASVLDRDRISANDSPSNSTPTPAPEAGWEEALRRWDDVIRDEPFWEHLQQRIVRRNEPQLSTRLARDIRSGLPVFVAAINAHLAVGAIQRATQLTLQIPKDAPASFSDPRLASLASDIKRQGQILARSPFDRADVDRAIRQALRPVRQHLQALCRSVGVLTPSDYTHPALQDGFTALTLFQYARLLPLNEKDRDDLQEDVSPALSKFCWFCQRRVSEFGNSVGVVMHGRVTREQTRSGLVVSYYYDCINVPRCWHCAQAHRGYALPPGVRQLSDKLLFPDVERRLREGYQLGTTPAI